METKNMLLMLFDIVSEYQVDSSFQIVPHL